MKNIYTLLFSLFVLSSAQAQFSKITGILLDGDSNPVEFANVVLYTAADSTLVKVETTGEDGAFMIPNVTEGNYYLEATSIGYDKFVIGDLKTTANEDIDLRTLTMPATSIELETAVVTAQRAMVEVKPDRTVFNVQGTINSAGDDGLSLLRKAPGVLVDNNDNISVLGRAGVLVYVDGKRLPLNGEDLSNFLRNLPAEQIDRIDIITNPGARYEAEGNAGIIDIRMKKNENYGMNGSISTTYSKGQFARGNINATGNYRNKSFNSFGAFGYNAGTNFMEMLFQNFQNGLFMDERNYIENENRGWNYRWGTDFFVSEKSTIGFIISGNQGDRDGFSANRNEISGGQGTPIDSILLADNINERENQQWTYNLNYQYRNKETMLNIDADYGRFRREALVFQPNLYYNPQETELLTAVRTRQNTPVDIDIYTFTVDYEVPLWGGKFGVGTKFSRVSTNNTFEFFDVIDDADILNNQRSNRFDYDEDVYAGYVNFARPISEKWNFSAGVRLEQTDATGNLQPFDENLQEPPVEQNYLSVFPSAGLTFSPNRTNSFNLNFGRRINRPDYNVLNPFREQLSELSFSQGNPFLRPEIVNNAELGWTLNYRYNFKLSYSRTTDQITRLIGPDNIDPRAGYITWENLAVQKVISFNASAPIQVTKGWSSFINLGINRTDNQATYDDGGVVDVQAWQFNAYQQQTFKLPGGFTGEISGWFSGPGVWGGVFIFESMFSLNLGLQKKLFNDQMNVRLSANDIFYQQGWDGESNFNGLRGVGSGRWDSRRVSLSVSMNFGNKKVKSRRRSTGIEAEAGRVGNDN